MVAGLCAYRVSCIGRVATYDRDFVEHNSKSAALTSTVTSEASLGHLTAAVTSLGHLTAAVTSLPASFSLLLIFCLRHFFLLLLFSWDQEAQVVQGGAM